MNGKIGENKLIGFLAGLAVIGATAWQRPDALAVVCTAVIALFSALINQKRDTKPETE